MKTKIIFSLLFLAFIANEVSAFTIIIAGGTRRHKFDYVRLDDNICKCTGRGSNECPIKFGGAAVDMTGNPHSLNDITEYVLKQVDNGSKAGTLQYDNVLPVSWKMIDDENIQIDIDDNGIKDLPK
jgi:hypothetical protein